MWQLNIRQIRKNCNKLCHRWKKDARPSRLSNPRKVLMKSALQSKDFQVDAVVTDAFDISETIIIKRTNPQFNNHQIIILLTWQPQPHGVWRTFFMRCKFWISKSLMDFNRWNRLGDGLLGSDAFSAIENLPSGRGRFWNSHCSRQSAYLSSWTTNTRYLPPY